MIFENAILVSIGDELLIGQTIDTNSAWIALALNKLGIQIKRKITISDTLEEIHYALDLAIPEADLIIFTGGLGPTRDDVTKHALNQYFGSKLVRNQMVHEHVVQFFKTRNRPMLPVNDFQADVPDVCTVLFNQLGTAPGMLFEKDNTWIVSLPGVPREMKSIVANELVPKIKKIQKANQYVQYRHLLLFGRGESFVAQDIEDIELSLPAHIHLSYLPNHGELKLRLSGLAKEPTALNKEMDHYFELIKARLSDYVVATEDVGIEEAIVKLLQNANLYLSTAESCTGGLIASKITDVPGASQIYMGSIVSYDNLIKEQELNVPKAILEEHGAVSSQTVEIMAQSVREKMKSDIAIAVSGILGPSGGTATKPVGLVYFGISSARGTYALHYHYHYDRAINKEMVAKTALNLVRKEIIALQNP